MANKQITDRLWEDAVAEGWTHEERLVWLFLCTCPQSQVAGLFSIALPVVVTYTGLGLGSVTRAIASLHERGNIVYDRSVVFIRKYAEGQNATRLGHFKTHVLKMARALKSAENKAVQAFLAKYMPIIREDDTLYENLYKGLGQPFIAIAIATVESSKREGGSGGKSEPEADRYFSEHMPEDVKADPGVVAAWREWIDYRREAKKPVTPRAAKLQFRQLQSLRDPPQRIACLEHSIANQYQGLFPEKQHYVKSTDIRSNNRTQSQRAQHTVTPDRGAEIFEHHQQRSLQRERYNPDGAP